MYDCYEDLKECAADSDTLWARTHDSGGRVLLGDRHGHRLLAFCKITGTRINENGDEKDRYVAWCRDTMENGGAQYAMGRITYSRKSAVRYALRVYYRGKLSNDAVIGG